MLLNNDSNTGSNVSLNLQVFPLFFIRFAYAGNSLQIKHGFTSALFMWRLRRNALPIVHHLSKHRYRQISITE